MLVVPTTGQGASLLVGPQALTTGATPASQLTLVDTVLVAMWSTIATHKVPKGRPRAAQRRQTPTAG